MSPPERTQRPLVNRAARCNTVLVWAFYSLGGLFALGGLGLLVEIVLGPGLLTGLMYGIEWLVACFALSAMAFGIGHEVRRRVEALTRCKRCGGSLQLVSARESNPRNSSEGYTEYTYVCAACGAQITMVEA